MCIESWQGDRELRDALIGTGRFEPSGEAQRLYYTAPDSGKRMWLDIVPFGGLERDGDALDLLEAHGFDPDVAGAALLARDMAALVAPAIRPLILAALAPGDAYPPLLNQMLGGGHRMLQFEGERPDVIEGLFNAFRTTLEREFAAVI